MRRLVVTAKARSDIEGVLRFSRTRFGRIVSSRYRRLINIALQELRRAPDRPAAYQHPDAPAHVWLCHLRHSRESMPVGDRIGAPRHVAAYWYDDSQVVVIGMLHDSMDIPARLGLDERR